MATIHEKYWQDLVNLAFKGTTQIKVANEFHGQMRQIKCLLANDQTALIARILEFQIHCATVPFTFNANKSGFEKLLNDWAKNLNKGLNLDIPRGLRSFTEQYFRERWTSSFIGLRLRWGKKDGYWIPQIMFLQDGAGIWAENKSGNLDDTIYYKGKISKGKPFQSTANETVLIRKPYNSWTDKYPTPYLVKVGALYHALKKQAVLERQDEIVQTAFPYQFFIKAGTEQMIQNGVLTQEALEELKTKFQDKKQEYDEHIYSKGLVGAFPFHVNFEEMIPDYAKALDEKILKGTDRNLLSALGLIELKGFSSTREEAILNPKVLVEEIIDSVLDYKELLEEVVELIKERNVGKTTVNDEVIVTPGIIKSFVDDNMKTMIRSWYDRGVVGQKDGLESTTPLDFETQVMQRDKERKQKLDEKLYPRVVQNLEKDPADLTPNDNVPDDKKKNTPESKNYRNACEETECITEAMTDVNDIPEEIRAELSIRQSELFIEAFNEKLEECKELDKDAWLCEKESLEHAVEVAVKEYVEAPYNNIKELPPSVKKNLPVGAQRIFMRVVNQALKDGKSESDAFKLAWGVVKKTYREPQGNEKKWKKK